MSKSKLCGIVFACVFGFFAMNPIPAAAEDNSESLTLSQKNKDQQDQRAAFEDAVKNAIEKWGTLNDKQKAEVYTLLENEMKAEYSLLDKLVELGVFAKEDATFIKERMQEKLNSIKKSGDFPLAKPQRERKQ
ncbi:MAG: DUF2680 domain-containing protein [Mobilitalea sp.]